MTQKPDPTRFAPHLLAWYDEHARALPWRVSPADRARGVAPNPYHVWLSEIMLQQTTVAAVKDYFHRFTTRWPTVESLAEANDDAVMAEWAGLGYYARARNLLKTAREIAQTGGRFPQDYDDLLKLPGIGPYTAAAISSIAFDRCATVVDGNVERVISRIFDVSSPMPEAKPALKAHAETLTPDTRPGDYAQAMMDLGATVCRPTSPLCDQCPVSADCAALANGTMAERPVKPAKKPKPHRFGIAYVARNDDGAYLLETRAEKGLLGGMLGWPTTEWVEGTPEPAHPIEANWQTLNATAEHVFTHFRLTLQVQTAQVGTQTAPQRGAFVSKEAFSVEALPTVMRKVFKLVPHQ